jgi:hypothetical protein
MNTNNAILKTSYEWLADPKFNGLLILDPDGWDRQNYEQSMSELITEVEFNRRVNLSTVSIRISKAFEAVEFTD